MSSRRIILVLLAGVALLLSAQGVFAQQKIVLEIQQSPQGAALQAIVPDFEKETGIKVEVLSYPYDQLMSAYRMEYNTKSGLWDVCSLSGAWMYEGINAGYHVPLNEFDMSMINTKDIPFFGMAGSVKGVNYGVPWYQEVNTLFLRTDLLNDPKEKAAFKKQFGYALALPKTEEQYFDQLKFFTRPAQNLYGCIIYGKRAPWIQIAYQVMLRARGLTFMDWDTYQPFNTTPGVIQTMKDFKGMFKYAAPFSYGADWFEGNANWQAGMAYSMISWSTVFLYSNDPDVSKVAGKVTLMAYPSKLKQVEGLMVQECLSVSSTSKNKEAAWKFIAYATKHQKDAVLKARIGHMPESYSAMRDPEVNKKYPLKNLADMMTSLKRVLPSEPPIPEGTHIDLEVLTKYLSLYVNGDLTAEEAGKQLDDEINDILVQGGYPTPWLKN
jgi:multiple sugar transport system substrate-binding protein